jgi:predicted transcriptional regulator
MTDESLITFTSDIVVAHLSRNAVPVNDVGGLISKVHGALVSISGPSQGPPAPERSGFVPASQSIKPDFLICLECGKRHKTIRLHLNVAHGLTPDQYRVRYALPPDYSMSAPNQTKRRQEIARTGWVGRRRTSAAGSKSTVGPRAKGKPRGRPRKSAT